MSKWHAVCKDCDDFERVGRFVDVLEAATGHQSKTTHTVDAGRVEA